MNVPQVPCVNTTVFAHDHKFCNTGVNCVAEGVPTVAMAVAGVTNLVLCLQHCDVVSEIN